MGDKKRTNRDHNRQKRENLMNAAIVLMTPELLWFVAEEEKERKKERKEWRRKKKEKKKICRRRERERKVLGCFGESPVTRKWNKEKEETNLFGTLSLSLSPKPRIITCHNQPEKEEEGDPTRDSLPSWLQIFFFHLLPPFFFLSLFSLFFFTAQAFSRTRFSTVVVECRHAELSPLDNEPERKKKKEIFRGFFLLYISFSPIRLFGKYITQWRL